MARTSPGLSHHNKLVITHGEYPFVLFYPADAILNSGDRFTLESADGGYRETLTLGQAKRGKYGHLVLWFPLPPKGVCCHLQVEPAGGGPNAHPYYIFRDQPTTYLCEEEG